MTNLERNTDRLTDNYTRKYQGLNSADRDRETLRGYKSQKGSDKRECVRILEKEKQIEL